MMKGNTYNCFINFLFIYLFYLFNDSLTWNTIIYIKWIKLVYYRARSLLKPSIHHITSQVLNSPKNCQGEGSVESKESDVLRRKIGEIDKEIDELGLEYVTMTIIFQS